MNVMIIGSRGFLGKALVAHLVKEGEEVAEASSQIAGGIDPVNGLFLSDFRIPAGVDAVVYLAQSPYSGRDGNSPAHVLSVNVVSAVFAGLRAAEAGVKVFVYASSGNVYANTFLPANESANLKRSDWYSLSKVQAEEGLRLRVPYLQVRILRLFGVYGPWQTKRLIPNLLQSVRQGKTITLDANPVNPEDRDGHRLSLCYVDDVVRIISSVLRGNTPELLNVAGPYAASIREIATLAGQLIGREPNFKVLNEPRSGNLIADIGLLQKYLNPHFTSFKAGLAQTISASKGGLCIG